MGRYLKMMKYRVGTASRVYSLQSFLKAPLQVCLTALVFA
jgi:hypothetical protein